MAVQDIVPISESLYIIASSSANPYLISTTYAEVGQSISSGVENIQIFSSSVEYLSTLATYGIDPNNEYAYCSTSSIVSINGFNSSSYVIDNVGNRCIAVNPCFTYEFQVNSPGQPFWIQTENYGGYNSASVYENGVTNNGIDSGSVFLEINNDTPEFLYYASENSPIMRGTIILINDTSACLPQPTPAPEPSPTATPTVTPTITPTVTPSISYIPGIRVHVLGDTGVIDVASSISSELSTLGYSANVTSQVLGTTYTGADLSTSLYDVVVMYTNASQIGASGLSSNISSFQGAGGHFIASTFLWNLYPAGFDFNLTPWTGPVGQTNVSPATLNNIVAHPITLGVTTTVSPSTLLVNTVSTLQSGAQQLADFNGGQKFLAIRDTGTSKQVGVNGFLGSISTSPGLRRYMANSILWTVGMI